MKLSNRILIYPVLFLCCACLFIACSDDDSDLPNNGRPYIEYIRVTTPEASDSLLVSATQGALIAIVGENLQNTTQVWFNDQRAELSKVYITNHSVLTTVPSKIPTVVTDQLKLVMANGDTLMHGFVIDISEPIIQSMESEYVPAGGIALIRGNYFYEPMTVTFAGGVTGEVSSIEDENHTLYVEVPEGAEPGPITITTNFGETTSDFWFRDNRNIFLSSDPWMGSVENGVKLGEAFVEADPGEGDPPAINGNYIHIKKKIGPWEWTPVAQGTAAEMGEQSKNIPDDAIVNPADYNLKFEVNTMLPYNNNTFKMQFALSEGWDAGWNQAYLWLPPYDTQGRWETIVIPLEIALANLDNSVSADGYDIRFLFHGDGALDADISFDNFRVVPKTLD